MKFTLADTRERYRETLGTMVPSKVKKLGKDWDKAALGFYFGADDGLADISVRDTLVPILTDDARELESGMMVALLEFVDPDKLAKSVAAQIHRAYLVSKPKQ